MTERAELLAALEKDYQRAKGVPRTLRLNDRLEEDLDVDSLIAMELLAALEDRYDAKLIGDPRTTQVRTVSELIDLLLDAVSNPTELSTSYSDENA